MQLTNLQQQLVQFLTADAALATPVYASQTDAAVATALNTPPVNFAGLILRNTPITYTTLAASNVWGSTVTAQFMVAVKAAAAQTANAELQGLALVTDSLLSDQGLLPTDPQSIPDAQALLVAFPTILTQLLVNAALCVSPYLVGNGTIQTADVTASRSQIAINAAWNTANGYVIAGWNAVGKIMSNPQSFAAASDVPTGSQIATAFTNGLTAAGG